jgi:NADH dehydrogenase
MSDSNRPRVVIVGAGFGGLWAARKLARHQVDVTVVDKNNYHTFFPLLYQVAAAELEPEDIIYPVRSILRRRHNVSFRLGEVRGIDYTSRTLMMAQGKNIPYDYLLLSLGSKEYFYRVAGADKFAYPLKNLEHAIQLRNHILCCFESAFYEADPERRKQLLTFTIVGGPNIKATSAQPYTNEPL